MANTKTYTGIDLLNLILQFMLKYPLDVYWNYAYFKDNQSGLIRLQQIHSLLKAFSIMPIKDQPGIDQDLKYFIDAVLNGNFIRENCGDELEELRKYVNQFMGKTEDEYMKKLNSFEVKFIYPKIMNYKIKLNELLYFNSRWLEASRPFTYFHIVLIESINDTLDGKYDQLDRVLELIINPKNLSFTQEELVSNYNFPEEDLHEIERQED